MIDQEKLKRVEELMASLYPRPEGKDLVEGTGYMVVVIEQLRQEDEDHTKFEIASVGNAISLNGLTAIVLGLMRDFPELLGELLQGLGALDHPNLVVVGQERQNWRKPETILREER